jgi:hypothetical protein
MNRAPTDIVAVGFIRPENKTSPPFIPPLHKCGEGFTLKGIGGEVKTGG